MTDVVLIQADLAWVAGAIEADGSIFLTNKKYPTIRLSQSSREGEDDVPEMLQRAHRILGGKVYGPYTPSEGRNGKQDEYLWQIQGTEFQDTIDKIRPWLGTRKLAAAERIVP
jgi:hypothetical protein